MADPNTIGDSTDWLSTPLSSLAPVDASLRCQVCKEFYDTPMLTSCSHTFCSRCIRRCLSHEGKCPACRASSQENQLRSNWAMEELVNAFKVAREGALEFARAAIRKSENGDGTGDAKTATGRGKRKAEDAQLGAQAVNGSKRQTRSSSRRMRSTQDSEVSLEDPEDQHTTYSPLNDTAHGDDFPPDDGLVACPMCSKRMKEEAVFTHIDHCTGDSSPSKRSAPPNTLPERQISKPSNNLIPLATLGYGLLNDNALRKKLAALGISSSGSRTMMEQRHREWVTIWNSNCDAANPRKKAALLKELNQWEKTQGSRYNNNHAPQVTDVRHRDFDREGYSVKQDTSFRDLIANAKKSRTKAATPVPEPSPGEAGSITATDLPTPPTHEVHQPQIPDDISLNKDSPDAPRDQQPITIEHAPIHYDENKHVMQSPGDGQVNGTCHDPKKSDEMVRDQITQGQHPEAQYSTVQS